MIWNKIKYRKVVIWFCRAVVVIGIAVAIDQLNLNIVLAAVVFIAFEGLVAYIDDRLSGK